MNSNRRGGTAREISEILPQDGYTSLTYSISLISDAIRRAASVTYTTVFLCCVCIPLVANNKVAQIFETNNVLASIDLSKENTVYISFLQQVFMCLMLYKSALVPSVPVFCFIFANRSSNV